MKRALTFAMLFAAALFAPVPIHAQAQDAAPSASAPAAQVDQPTEQSASSEPSASFSAQSGAPSAGANVVVPLAPRGDNTAYRPAPEGAASK